MFKIHIKKKLIQHTQHFDHPKLFPGGNQKIPQVQVMIQYLILLNTMILFLTSVKEK